MMAEWARLARLHAMRDGTRQPIFPFEFLSNAELRDMLDNETKLARLLLDSRDDQKRGMLSRIEQLRQEIRGFEEQQTAYAAQRDTVQKDLRDLTPGFKSK
jgi:hypothetical protein